MNAIKSYVKHSFEELTRVTWPTKAQAVKLTIIVFGFCLVMAFFLGFVDYVLTYGYDLLLKAAAK